MRKYILVVFLMFPTCIYAQIDSNLLKLIYIRPNLHIDSSILKRRDFDKGSIPMFQGVWRTLNQSKTKVYSIGEYRNGVPDGQLIAFDDYGNIASSYYYYQGVLHGNYFKLWPNGGVEEMGSYIDGQLDGLYRSYDSTGKAILVTSFVKGVHEGPEIRFYPSGNIKIVTNYFQGREHGIRREFKDAVGNNLRGEFEMKDGAPISGKFYIDGRFLKHKTYSYAQEIQKIEASKRGIGDRSYKDSRELLSEVEDL